MRRVSINRYQSIGIKEAWIKNFIKDLDLWFTKNNLGRAQYKSFIYWLIDSGLIERDKSSYIINKLSEALFQVIPDSKLLWEIIWINLFYNSNLIMTYLQNFSWGSVLSKNDFVNIVKQSYPQLSERTMKNAFNSLLNTFENSPLGGTLKIGLVEKVGRERIVKKIGTDDIHPIAILYSLYRYAISKNRYRLTVSELYREDNKGGSPYLLFGISRNALENILRWLSEKFREYIYVEITADLDNINLCEDIKNHFILMEDLWRGKKI
ncbi:MAG: DUF4007 family protein [Candidatus Methanomethylicaceae archaeon]